MLCKNIGGLVVNQARGESTEYIEPNTIKIPVTVVRGCVCSGGGGKATLPVRY